MRFLTDENVAVSVVAMLRERGHDVVDVKEEGLAGAKDMKLREIARKEERIIVTHDKDFKGLFSPGNDVGVVLVRLGDQRPSNVVEKVGLLLDSEKRDRIPGNVVVVTDQRFVVHTAFGGDESAEG